MKPLHAVMLLAVSLGLGAFAHHLTEKRSRVPQVKSPAGAAANPAPAAPAPNRVKDVDVFLSQSESWTARDWINFGERLSSLTADQFPLLCAELAQRTEGKLQADSPETKTLLEYWSAADPDGLLRAAEQSQHRLSLFLCAPYCLIHDFPATAAAIQRQSAAEKDREKTARLWNAAFRILNERDPAGALRQAEALKLIEPESLLVSFAAKDGHLMQPLKDAIEEWAHRDSTAAVAFALKYPELQEAALEAWMVDQPEAMLSWMGTHSEIELHGEWMQRCLRGWIGKDAPAAVAWLEAHPDKVPEGPSVQAEGLVAWLSKHPEQAETYRGLFKDEDLDQDLFGRAVAVGYSAQSAEAAVKWIGTLEESRRDNAFRDAFAELRQRDPREAVSFLAQMPQYALDGFIEQGFSSLSNKNPAAAVEMLMSGRFSDQVIRVELPNAINGWLGRDPQAARAFIEAQPPSEVTGVLMLQASQILRDGDANSARDFALGLPDPALRLGACRKVLQEEFLRDDSLKAKGAEWIAAIPDSAIRAALTPMLAPRE